jgi:hypothetical protein
VSIPSRLEQQHQDTKIISKILHACTTSTVNISKHCYFVKCSSQKLKP